MSKGKTLVILNYLVILAWWCVLTVEKSKFGAGNTFFNLGMGLYALILSLSLVFAAFKYQHLLPKRIPVITLSIGMILFGIGSILWFIFDLSLLNEIPFPSPADFFYVLQSPIKIFGLTYLFSELLSKEGLSVYKVLYLVMRTFILVFMILILTLLATIIYSSGAINLENYLLFYFPIESFSTLLLTSSLYLKYTRINGAVQSKNLTYIIFGEVSWFVADSLFLYEVSSGIYFNASYPDILYVTGVFLSLLGLTGILEKNKVEGFINPIEPVYFQRFSYYSPFDLNLLGKFIMKQVTALQDGMCLCPYSLNENH